jgi:sugar lactone lactonase YvrE
MGQAANDTPCLYHNECQSKHCVDHVCRPADSRDAALNDGASVSDGGSASELGSDGTILSDGVQAPDGAQADLGQKPCKTPGECNDGLSCTDDICDGVCKNPLQAGFCRIASACVSSGTSGTPGACQVCAPDRNPFSWSSAIAPGCVATLAGSGKAGSTDGPAAQSSFNTPMGLAVAPNGDVLIADSGSHRIRRISGGTVTTVAGTGKGFQDGAVGMAKFDSPSGLALASDGTIYVADTENHTVRKIASGIVMRIAGQAGTAGDKAGDGQSQALLDTPHDVELSGDVLYISDRGNNRIKALDLSSGQVTVSAGSGSPGLASGAPLSAKFFQPAGLTLDAAGNVYLADAWTHTIRLLTVAAGQVTDVSSLAGKQDSLLPPKGLQDGPTASALFYHPWAVTLDATGKRAYVADELNHRIRVVDLTQKVVSSVGNGAAGSGTSGGFVDGPLSVVEFARPTGIAFFGGAVYVSDSANNRIRVYTPES